MSDVTATVLEATTSQPNPQTTIRLNGDTGNVVVGGNGKDGDLAMFDSAASGNALHDPNESHIHLDGKSATARFGGKNNTWGFVTIQGAAPFSLSTIDLGGANGAHVKLTPAGASTPSIHIDGEQGSIDLHAVVSQPDNTVGGANLNLFDTLGTARVQIEGQSGDLTLRGRVENDGSKSGSNLKLMDGKQAVRIHLDGNTGNISLTGDIFLTGADCAEEFTVTGAEVEPGTVLVISDGGVLKPSEHAYDRCVAGVVSRAGDCRPGLVLNHQSGGNGQPVALVGRVYCKADAGFEPIAAGDLLTTSPTPGHAMKASDPARAFGAVIGKALQPLAGGQGLIPILVAMQ